MTVWEILLWEFASLHRRTGGLKGVFTVLLLAAAASVLPLRLGRQILDPIVMILFCAIAPLYAGTFTAQAFAGERERAEIINGKEPPFNVALGKSIAAILWGYAAWIVLLIGPVWMLNIGRKHLLLPSVATLAMYSVFCLALGWGVSTLGALFALDATTPRSAQALVRGVVLLPILIGVVLSSFAGALRPALLSLLEPDSIGVTLLTASALLLVAGFALLRMVARKIDDLRHPLSIL